jgi:hypothetical protein
MCADRRLLKDPNCTLQLYSAAVPEPFLRGSASSLDQLQTIGQNGHSDALRRAGERNV